MWKGYTFFTVERDESSISKMKRCSLQLDNRLRKIGRKHDEVVEYQMCEEHSNESFSTYQQMKEKLKKWTWIIKLLNEEAIQFYKVTSSDMEWNIN